MRHWPLPDCAFHIADEENWPAIERSGLYSAEALIARSGMTEEQAATARGYRPEGLRLPGGALLRDQRPMPPDALARCLDPGLSPQDWYDLVNGKVFFWLDPARLVRHLAACAVRPQRVVTVDLRRLLDRHGDRASLTPFNVGNARRKAAPRGTRTFVPWAAWRDSRWQDEAGGGAPRPPSHPPADLAIDGAVPDLLALMTELTRSPA
jgi:hypothetical protein